MSDSESQDSLVEQKRGEHIVLVWVWRILAGAMSIILLITSALATYMFGSLQSIQDQIVEMDKRHVERLHEAETRLVRVEDTQFTGDEAGDLERQLRTEFLSAVHGINQSVAEINLAMAQLPPEKFVARVEKLEDESDERWDRIEDKLDLLAVEVTQIKVSINGSK